MEQLIREGKNGYLKLQNTNFIEGNGNEIVE
jgi:hypothetical protein